ncbi:hypothetical protein H7U18_09360 [Klebsiella pneumoniae]|uniref:Secreted protein n=1 Tax=Klebsiella pneumoniae TaxID=573 RepID=A0A923J6W9_KLEPN|nr:hypothetical protein [Klebsiella pneumoniae]
MNRAATLTLNAPLLMLVAALALSTPSPPAPRRPFLITPNSKPSNLRRKKNDAESAKQTQESRQSADNKNRYQHLTITKESPASRRRLHKKISLYSN